MELNEKQVRAILISATSFEVASVPSGIEITVSNKFIISFKTITGGAIRMDGFIDERRDMTQVDLTGVWGGIK